MNSSAITYLTIHGFKSIVDLNRLQLGNKNILIGSNGAGKSNFVSWFKMIKALNSPYFDTWVKQQGNADRIVSFGLQHTKRIESTIDTENGSFSFNLIPSVNNLLVSDEKTVKTIEKLQNDNTPLLSRWKVYHFNDTSVLSPMRLSHPVHDKAEFRSDGSNLAAYLYSIFKFYPQQYYDIVRLIRLAVPDFDDFIFEPESRPTEEQFINLQWRQKGSDYPFWPSQLSDGALRFIALTTALLQPNPPSAIVIDEPELGLHPYAISLLSSLIDSVSEQTQVIICTQSVSLVNEFSLDDIIVVERKNGQSDFQRLNAHEYSSWLDEYSTGQLWENNVIPGGLPSG